jgi:hypothetical protein
VVRFELGLSGGRLLRPATVQSLEAFGRTAGGYDGELVGVRGIFDGELPAVTVMSVATVRERGIVVAVMSNITSADTSAVARKVGDAFASGGTRQPITGSSTAGHR